MNRIIYILALCLVASLQTVVAQINAPKAEWKTLVGSDSLFCFSSWTDAELVASSEGENGVEWYLFDASSESYSKLVGDKRSIRPASAGGYMCRIVDGGNVRNWYAWVDVPTVDGVSMSIDSVYCDGMDVTAKADGLPMRLFNRSAGKWESVAQRFTYSWYAADTLQLVTDLMQPTLDSPMSECQLKVVAENQVGNRAEAADSVQSFGVKAIFSHEVRERNVPNEITTGEAYSAPAEFAFTNKSKGNVTVSEWVMGMASRIYDTNPVYSFQNTGEYRVSLIVTDETTGCSSVDSTMKVTITDAFLEFPDVFTPNGDGVNDEFRPAYKSLKSYELTIYNRWGRRVYHSTNPSEGWNGKEGGSNAAEGTYMYVAEAFGYDKDIHMRRHGSLTLVR